MIRVELSALLARLTAPCRHGLEEAASVCISQQGAEVTVSHLMFALLEQPLGDVRCVLARADIANDVVKQALATSFRHADGMSDRYPSFSPLLVELLQEAWLLGSVELGQEAIRSGCVLLAALLHPARYLPQAAIDALEPLNRETLRKHFATWTTGSSEAPSLSAGGMAAPTQTDQDALSKYASDLTAQARARRIDPVLCRDEAIDQMVDILSRRRKNNPIVVGDPGVGKSAVVEGLALRIAAGSVPAALQSVALWSLDLGALQAGASVKGEFEKRLKGVIDDVKASPHPIILFIDEAHTLIGAGNAAGGSDAANLLKPALARGELRTVAATTWAEYKRYFEKDPALSRRFQPIKLGEPSEAEAVHILRGLRHVYEQAHGVVIGDDAIHAAVSLSTRYLAGRQLPDKAIDALDTACARVAATLVEPPRRLTARERDVVHIDTEIAHLERDRRLGRTVDASHLGTLAAQRETILAEISRLRDAWSQQRTCVETIHALRAASDGSEADLPRLAEELQALAALQREEALLHADVGRGQIAQVIADWTGVPCETLGRDHMERLRDLPVSLTARVRGQYEALEHIHRHLLTAMADLRREGTPLGAFLLVGPSGVGKTETALAVADALFGGKAFLTVINLSEYQEPHSVSRLLGAPPGYVGYGEGGVLTEAIRQRPYSVVLLDEVEKAHPDVLNVFYQAFDKGELADGEGRTIDCRNVLFFLTSNLGFDRSNEPLTDPDNTALRERLLAFFKPALLARMQVVRYRHLDEGTLADIVEARLERIQARFVQRYRATLRVSEAARATLKGRCIKHAHGARLLDASIEGDVLPALSLATLQRLTEGHRFQMAYVDWDGERFTAQVT